MADSSRHHRSTRHSTRKEKRAPCPPRSSTSSPPAYSVEENTEGELVNSRLDVKWPQHVGKYDERRYLAFDDDDSMSERLQSERRSRKKKEKKEKREKKEKKEKDRKKREETVDSNRARSPLSAEGPYISLSVGSEKEQESDLSKSVRRERKAIQTSPQASQKSWRSGYHTEEEGKAVDSIVFDTRSQMHRYQQNGDILPTKTRRSSARVTAASKSEVSNQYYVGVKKTRAVEKMLVRPGQFVLYYEQPREGEMPTSVSLKVAYRSSAEQAHHFPIRCFEGTDGHSHYVVMQNECDGKMFTSIPSLVKHYSHKAQIDNLSVSH